MTVTAPSSSGTARRYLETHRWISFKVDIGDFAYPTWLLTGEAESKCHHIAGVLLFPEIAEKLLRDSLSKGIHGTVSIEGDTLSEEEVLLRVEAVS